VYRFLAQVAMDELTVAAGEHWLTTYQSCVERSLRQMWTKAGKK